MLISRLGARSDFQMDDYRIEMPRIQSDTTQRLIRKPWQAESPKVELHRLFEQIGTALACMAGPISKLFSGGEQPIGMALMSKAGFNRGKTNEDSC